MPTAYRPDHLRNTLAAEGLLARQALGQEALELWRTETCPRLQQLFAQQYRRLVGVHPAHHQALQDQLEAIRDHGGPPVADILAALERTQSSGLGEERAGSVGAD